MYSDNKFVTCPHCGELDEYYLARFDIYFTNTIGWKVETCYHCKRKYKITAKLQAELKTEKIGE